MVLTCDDGNATRSTFAPVTGSACYMAEPRSYAREGSYSLEGAGIERPASLSARLAQQIATCP